MSPETTSGLRIAGARYPASQICNSRQIPLLAERARGPGDSRPGFRCFGKRRGGSERDFPASGLSHRSRKRASRRCPHL